MVPRGAGTSLAGGALPQEDAVVLGVAKMNRVLEIDYDEPARPGRGRRHQSRRFRRRRSIEGFFYAPDPSSQLACTIAGNIAMNSGGAHCLKYGVTTNNLLGVTHGADRRHDRRDRRRRISMRRGLRPARRSIIGSEGQLGIVTEATVRILPLAEGARPVLIGFHVGRGGGRLRRRHHRRRHHSRSRSSSWTSRRSRSARPSPMPAIRSTSRRC